MAEIEGLNRELSRLESLSLLGESRLCTHTLVQFLRASCSSAAELPKYAASMLKPPFSALEGTCGERRETPLRTES
jgi:hypothetical protein